jgi:hypothetical protein
VREGKEREVGWMKKQKNKLREKFKIQNCEGNQNGSRMKKKIKKNIYQILFGLIRDEIKCFIRLQRIS